MRKPSKLAVRTMAQIGTTRQAGEAPMNGNMLRLKGGYAKGAVRTMKRRIWLVLLLAIGLWGRPAAAQGLLGGLLSNVATTLSNLTTPQPGVIVRTNLGLAGLQNVCLLNGCTVVGNIDGSLNQVFLVKPVQGLLPNLLAGVLRLVTGIVDAEPDQTLVIPPNPTSQSTSNNPPAGLWDNTPVNYYGNTVTDGYVNQPAAKIIQLSQAQSVFNVSGAGIVADSVPAADYDETLNKAKGMLNAIVLAETQLSQSGHAPLNSTRGHSEAAGLSPQS